MRRERSSRSCCGVESEVDSAAAVLFVPIGNMCAQVKVKVLLAGTTAGESHQLSALV